MSRTVVTEGAAVRRIWTVGHSNRTAEAFLAVLASAGIELVADVRRFPGSRTWPHFREDALRALLDAHGIGYEHFPALGGRRGTPAEGSPNTGWRVASFGAYADHMASAAFHEGLARLEALAADRRTAVMCSEAVPWRCHRRLIADALLVRGWEVLDLLAGGRVEPRPLTTFACVHDDGTITYPPA